MIVENLFKELEQYFANTPKDQILSDWAETEQFENIGTSVDVYLQSYPNLELNSIPPNLVTSISIQNIDNLNFISGFFFDQNS